MDKSQWYIGAQNGVVLCVDSIQDSQFSGKFYHNYSPEPVVFYNADQLVFKLENFFDSLNFPYPSTNNRYFSAVKPKYTSAEKKVKMVTDEELLQKKGSLSNFIIRVQHRQNSSWQGRITWMDENKTVNFRSVWEMIKLIENALDTVSVPEDQSVEAAWSDQQD